MARNNTLAIIGAFLVLLAVVGGILLLLPAGLKFSFASITTPPDPFYNYTMSVNPYVQGGPLQLSITAHQAQPFAFSGTLSPNCNSYYSQLYDVSAFNARSVQVYLDGASIYSGEQYPTLPANVLFSSSLTDFGTTQCWGSETIGVNCGGWYTSNMYNNVPYAFWSGFVPQNGSTITDGSNILNMQIPIAPLANGTHTVDVYYFANTISMQTNCNAPQQTLGIAAWDTGDYNHNWNEHNFYTFQVGQVAPVNITENETQEIITNTTGGSTTGGSTTGGSTTGGSSTGGLVQPSQELSPALIAVGGLVAVMVVFGIAWYFGSRKR